MDSHLQHLHQGNKKKLAEYVKKANGVELDPNSIFDVQVKRLHEYKRQHLNAFHILSRYIAIKENPDGDFTPHTYIFAAKAASGYFMAKKIISFICAISDMINNDPDMRGRLKVVYLEDYNVTLAEKLMPAADISEQISLSGTVETGNNTTYTSSGSGAFLGFVQYAVPVLYKDSKADVNPWTYTLSLEGMEDVWAVFSMRYDKSKGEGASNEGNTYILEVTLQNYEKDAALVEHPCSMTLTLYSNLGSQSGGQTVSWNGHNVIE